MPLTPAHAETPALSASNHPCSRSPPPGSSWARTPARTASAPSIASGSTPSSSPPRKSPTPNTRASSAQPAAPPPPFWQDPNFNHPQQPVTGSLLARSRPLLRMAERANRPRLPPAHRSRMGTRRPRRPRAKTIPLGRRSAAIPPRLRHALANRPRASSPATPPTHSASTTSATTSTNGAATGTTRTTTPSSPDRNPRGPEQSPTEAAPQILPRRLLAPPHQSSPLLRPLQHPPEFQYADYGFRVACD